MAQNKSPVKPREIGSIHKLDKLLEDEKKNDESGNKT